MNVPVIQFMRPDGRQVPQVIDLPEITESDLLPIEKCRCRLTAEVLMNDKCSFCIEHRDFGDFAQVICENGPLVVPKLTSLIKEFRASDFETWKTEMEEA